MHYCVHIFTKGCPTDTQLEEILEPYDDNKLWDDLEEGEEPEKFPTFTWDSWALGGRYGGLLKLDVNAREDFYEWSCLPRNDPRNNRLFKAAILDKGTSAWDESGVFNYIGYPDGYIRVDGAYVCDILNRDKLGCYGFIDPNGMAYVRKYWDGHRFIDNEDFKSQYKTMIETAVADSSIFVTVIDIHD